MMDLSKQFEFYEPDNKTVFNIVGCGSVGSTIAELLVRCGITNIILYDFDTVESHNIVNQMFRAKDFGRPKVDALKDLLAEINPDCADTIKVYPNGWQGEMMSGYVFLAVDSIELRKKIVEQHFNNIYVKAMFDVRTLLTGAQARFANWKDRNMKQIFLDSMQFSDADAEEAVPVSACGTVLGVVTTVRLISAMIVNDYIKFAKGETPWKYIEIDGFSGELIKFE